MTDETIKTIQLTGHIDSNNAADTEKKILDDLSGQQPQAIVFDAENLEYISSAGLRILLRVMKAYPNVRITNVRPGVYEILDTTGFTQLMTVEKAYRRISVEGCEEVGRGASGTIYRIDQDNVVKVYNDRNALEEIINEREMAKLALILGIPTAISYEIVRVGESYGSVFELLDAVSFSHLIATDPSRLDWCIEENIKLLNTLHTTHVPDGKLPDIRNKYLSKIEGVRDILTDSVADRLCDMIMAVPFDDRMIHGDFHTKNIMLLDNDVLLVDMETISTGHPVFEFASMFDAYIGFSEPDREQVLRFQGFDYATSERFWHETLSGYLGTKDADRIREVEDKARIPGYVRMIHFMAKSKNRDTEAARTQIAYWKDKLLATLDRVNSLTFE